MNKWFVVVLMVILFCYKTDAQSNFKDGFVLLTETDTLYGKINDATYFENSKYCDFKGENSDSVTRYYAGKIYGYQFVNGKFYISKEVVINNRKAPVFLEYLVNGHLDVYFNLDNKNKSHFFVSKDTLPTLELGYSDQIVNTDKGQYREVKKPYVGVLQFYTSDCDLMKNDIDKLDELDKKKIISFAKKYHQIACKDEVCISYEKSIPRKIKLHVISAPFFRLSSKYEVPEQSFTYGFNFLYQTVERSERMYVGLGLLRLEGSGVLLKGYQIPLSFNYIHPKKQGFSLMASYEFDINQAFIVQGIKVGGNYQYKKFSVFIAPELKTERIVRPFAAALNFGLGFDLMEIQ